jgi:hypothetical protein
MLDGLRISEFCGNRSTGSGVEWETHADSIVMFLACFTIFLLFKKRKGLEYERCYAGLSNAAPVIYTYFPGVLFYSAGFNVNQNFKKKIFLNNSMSQFFS